MSGSTIDASYGVVVVSLPAWLAAVWAESSAVAETTPAAATAAVAAVAATAVEAEEEEATTEEAEVEGAPLRPPLPPQHLNESSQCRAVRCPKPARLASWIHSTAVLML